jgi:glucokinase
MLKSEISPEFVIGVDVGGTKVAAGLVDSRGVIHQHTRVPMNAVGTAAQGLAAVTSAVEALIADATPQQKSSLSIGICAPGPLDPLAGIVLNPPNVPCWRNFPLAAEISRQFNCPVKIDNDANAAALAEGLWGAGRGFKNVFYACIGTGIGTGILLDGEIFHGRTGAAAEGGHVTIDLNGPKCGCGKKGCIEALASGTAIASRAKALLASRPGVSSAMRSMAESVSNTISAEIVGKAFAEGDSLATEILHSTFEFLAAWLGNIIDLLEPDVIIIGGGVAAMFTPHFGEIKQRLPAWCINSRCLEIPIVPAHYGANAGIAGGAALCQNPSTREPD